MLPVSHRTHADDFATARQQIDEEITTLKARIVSLKTTRNTFTTTARLPIEVMQEIFVITSRSAGDRGVGKAALLMTWICHSWRELAHEASELWSYVDFLNRAWVERALSRTRDRTLHLSFDFQRVCYEDSNRVLSICLDDISRIGTLHITQAEMSVGQLGVSLNPLWTISAPLLVELALDCRALPSNLTPEIFPALRRLSLDRCEFNWKSLPIRTGLKALRITNPRSRTSPEYVLDKLRLLGPTLESLLLYNTLPHTLPIPVPNPPSHETRHELTKIQDFNILDDYGPPIIFILNHLLLPSDVDNLEIYADNGDEDQFDTVRALVACRGIDNWPVETVEFDVQYYTLGIRMTDSRSRSLSFSIDNHDINHLSILPVFDLFPSLPMKVLILSGNSVDDNVSALLAQLDAPGTIEQIKVVQAFVPTFTAILYNQNQRIREITGTGLKGVGDIGKKMDNATKARCRDVITFPKLTTLEYYGDERADRSGLSTEPETGEEEEFTAYWYSKVLSEKESRFSVKYFEVLSEWLEWRQVVGLGVGKLVFNGMNIPPKRRIERLFEGIQLEYVDVVHVTGKTKGSKVLAFKVNPNA
ncbi:hypothetical protein BDN72DRAFT_936687 [Pluteus cervinus]|uniref:Uncharacterized protein n=1 Tax=Pluteus cervinus TaxID=181527 RepID=A0ACD3A6B0_9AGAR|nr:hypothetical protein BDN72DRAFT_936687 [Pluteus cervinus]